MVSLIQHFEADFLWKVSLKILNSGTILKTFTHELQFILFSLYLMIWIKMFWETNKLNWIEILIKEIITSISQARGYKTFFMLNSAEHEIYPAHKC